MWIIKPAAGLITQLPMCAVFTMDPGSGFIINLAFYFDRWKLAHDKWDKNNPPHIDGGAAAATEFLGGLSAGVTCRFVSKLHAKVDWPCQALDTRHSMGLLEKIQSVAKHSKVSFFQLCKASSLSKAINQVAGLTL